MSDKTHDDKAKHHDFEATEQDIEEVNNTYKNTLQIRPCKYGYGLFADRKFQVGDKVMSGKAMEIKSNRDSHSVQTSWNTHAIMNLPAIFINHCCNANVGIQDNELGAFDFMALKEINVGDELLWDYEASEWEIQGFQCSCGASNCRRELKGFSQNGEQLLKLYGENYVAKYLLSDRK